MKRSFFNKKMTIGMLKDAAFDFNNSRPAIRPHEKRGSYFLLRKPILVQAMVNLLIFG